MGCTQSKIDNNETVNRCKERKQYMERAVMFRNKFASSHSATAMSLKNAGAALSDFAQGEVVAPVSSTLPPHFPPPYENSNNNNNNFILPPPPLPEFSVPRPGNGHVETIIEEEENEDEDEDEEGESEHEGESDHGSDESLSSREDLPPAGKKKVSWDYFFEVDNAVETNKQEIIRKGENGLPKVGTGATAAKVEKRVKQVVNGDDGKRNKLSLVQVCVELDDCFLKASECAHEVSRMLEAIRLHYHSNFADQRGQINHSEKVMRVITWNKSIRGFPRVDDDIDDEFDSEGNETHATVLDKMLAWEKKLFDEVKAGEHMKYLYQKKVAALNKLKTRGSRTEKLEKMKATVSHLHTRYIVDMQTMDSTVTEINCLRDNQLYPKLVALVDGLATMWETMRCHHESQSKTVQALRMLDISQSPKETTDHHHEHTRQLCGVFQDWHRSFSDLMTYQKEYVKSVNNWLKLNLIPIDTNWKDKVPSPSGPQNPPIQVLLHAWNDYLDKLPDEPAKATINNFAAIINTIWEHQKEELEYRNRCENSRKDLNKKTIEFENWYNKYMHKRTGEADHEREHMKDVVSERQMLVETAKQKLEEYEEAYQRQCVQVREKSLISLKSHLPELFQSLSEFSFACSDMYSKLRSISRTTNRNDVR